jgi:hypothetical protein
VREPGRRRAGQEEGDRELEYRLAAEQVADLPVDRHYHGHGQEVGGDHPANVVQSVQVAGDGWQCRGNDRLIERGEQHA